MTNCEKIRNAVRPCSGQTLSSGKVISLVLSMYPGTNPTSIIPSDHSGPNPRSGRSYCSCCGTAKQVFARSGGAYLVRAANEEARIDPVHQSQSQLMAPERMAEHSRVFAGSDHVQLASFLRKLKPSIRQSSDRAWRRNAALRVMDCVLSLNRRYDSFVVPRLDRFERAQPAIRTVSDLQSLIAGYSSPSSFLSKALDYNDAARALTLIGVVDWLSGLVGGGDYDAQMQKLLNWAANAKPEGHLRLGITGFGLGGFQYLRMLFGANTTKPDIHIQRFVSSCVGRRVSDVQALALLEAAAVEVGIHLRDLDTTIWERSARGA